MAFSPITALTFLKDVRHELKSVQWPSRATTVRFTVLIVAVTVAVAVMTGAFDFVLTFAVERFLLRQ